MSGFSNPRCYAQKNNKCSNKISREHIISNNILEFFEKNKTVKIAGLPWMKQQTFNLLSRNSLASNILCTAHNSSLSGFDTEAGKLFKCISKFDADFNNPNPKNEHRQINGDYIERWMLKIICGLIASNQISTQGSKITVPLPDLFVDILFEKAKFPENWGLYFKVPEEGIIHKFGSVGITTFTGNRELKAAEFLINNFKFYLLLGNPDNPTSWGIHRIGKIILKEGSISKVVEFTWEDKENDGSFIELTRSKTSDETPKDWEDWMKR